MSLSFRNRTPNTVYISYVSRDAGCPEGFSKTGWFSLSPGETQRVFIGNARRVDSYYAEDDFGHVWSGEQVFTSVPNTAFIRWCLNKSCSPCRRLGFRFVNSLAEELTINLTLGRNQRITKSGKICKAFPTKRKRKFRKFPHGIIRHKKSNG